MTTSTRGWSHWTSCRGNVRFAGTTRSSVMDAGFASPMTIGTDAYGHGADSVSMWEDVYCLARLAGTVRAFQFALPTTGLRIHRRRRLNRASRTSLQRSVALSRSIHATPV